MPDETLWHPWWVCDCGPCRDQRAANARLPLVVEVEPVGRESRVTAPYVDATEVRSWVNVIDMRPWWMALRDAFLDVFTAPAHLLPDARRLHDRWVAWRDCEAEVARDRALLARARLDVLRSGPDVAAGVPGADDQGEVRGEFPGPEARPQGDGEQGQGCDE